MTKLDSQHAKRKTTTRTSRFFFIYLWRGLRGRSRQAVIVSAGLAVGVSAVVTLTAASTGVSHAQSTVLHALYGVGTDITVTKSSSGGSGSGGASSGRGLITPKDRGTTRFILPPGLNLLGSSAEASIAKLHGVAEVAGGLSLIETIVGMPPSPHALPPITSVTLDGVDVAHLKLGPYASTGLTSGRSFTRADSASDVAVIDAGYAKTHSLRAGSTITISGNRFTVIGIVSQPPASNPTDVYIPLRRAQAIASIGAHRTLAGKVNAIYVSAASAADIGYLRARIAALLPTATVTSSSDLASKVSGSLASAAKLATDLGRWVALAMLVAAFALAGLVTTGAVRRRVRELGTLKALGWRSRRIVAQIMAESLVTGIAGAAIGIGLGFLGAALIDTIAPNLSATVALNPGSTPPQGAIISNGSIKTHTLPDAARSISVHLHATISGTTIALALMLAVGGAVLAGAAAGWRAARLRPAHALVRVA